MKLTLKKTKTQISALFAGVFGDIQAPTGVAEYNRQANGIGIVVFASNLIKVFTILMGIIILVTLFKAGFEFISHSDDVATVNKVKDRVTMSIIGIVVVAAAYTIAGLIGLIFFNDAGFILNPVFTGPTN